MHTDLGQIVFGMFKDRVSRASKNGEFKPCFYRFIGVFNRDNYDNILKTLQVKCEENKDISIIFDGKIPLSGEMELIQYILNELNRMDVQNLKNEEINIFNNREVNSVFLRALDYVVSIALSKESFFNDNLRNNFITKLIVWSYTYLREIDFYGEVNPKCVYYGNIEKHEIYFLILLHLMSFDVLYINPLKEEYFNELDRDKLSQEILSKSILPVESFKERAARGKVIEDNETITKKIQREVEEELFSNTGMFKPWQFRDGNTEVILLDTILEDIYIYWNEPSKLRHNFGVKGKTVRVPCIFMKIDGEYEDTYEYVKLLKHCKNSPNTLFFNTGEISGDGTVTEDMYQLMFYQLSDGTFDIEKIKELPVYSFGKYSEEVQNLLLSKFNETLLDKDLFVKNFDRERSLKLLVLILSLSKDIIRLVDSFDFTSNIPKIVIALNGEEEISEDVTMLLGYLHKVGFDIVIFNPSGLFNINNVIKTGKVNVIRLNRMNYNLNFRKLLSYKGKETKKSLFSKLLDF
ncbi:YceG family protein [Clostridium sp. LIBA-8841]|uniref:YceG family protein n=1 Tax=Clostridium sp. LIBA-8841 TaxID=2987530 RepID=UPI002AC3F1D1|nr:YceG family protein [Clostridium sp. LIBA-8841]MDZ5253572.1 YceG family protein [Clostridium sp. LIBA-8841]